MTLANGMAEDGWDVTLVVLNLENAVYQYRLDPKLKLVNLHKGHARTALFALWNYLLNARPERILAFNHQLVILLILIRIFSFLRFSIISRNINTLSLLRENESSLWHKYAVNYLVVLFYNKVDHVIAQSSGMKHDLVDYFGLNDDKITVINNPINQNIESFVKDHDLSKIKKQDYLLCIGRLSKAKAFHFAIRSFAVILPEFPGLRLKIVGKGPMEMQLKELAYDLGVFKNIDFEGFQPDVIPYYLNAKITVLTSLFEGFPNVLVESIALGTPVVAFNCSSGPSDIVQNGVNGFLVRYKDITHLKECLRSALTLKWDIHAINRSVLRYKSDAIITEYEKVILK